MAFLELQNVSKSHGYCSKRAEVLHDINLSISKSEFVAIVGYSGAGKTTLMSLIAGLQTPDEGPVALRGETVTAHSPDRAIVFQNYSLLPWLSIYENIADGIGFASVSMQDMLTDHAENVCAFLGEFGDKKPKPVKALHEASVWLDDMINRPEQCDIVSKATYINCDAKPILGRLQVRYDYGDGSTKEDPNYLVFSERNCNYPQTKYAHWWLTQFRRWGMVSRAPEYAGVAKQVMRGDLYAEAMKEIGVTDRAQDDSGREMFDGVKWVQKTLEQQGVPLPGHTTK